MNEIRYRHVRQRMCPTGDDDDVVGVGSSAGADRQS